MTQTDTRGSGGPGLRWCALCGTEYVPGVAECADCLVPLVDSPPLTADDVGDESSEQLAYELDDVDNAERLAIDRDLAERGIIHAWDGTTLVVAPYDEEEVDAVLARADVEELDDDEDQVVYELADWDEDRRAELGARLAEQRIAHGFDEQGDLVVQAADEDAVDALLDEVEFPNELAVDADDADDAGADGLDAIETLGALFVSADRLTHDPTDSDGVLGAADAARSLATMATPFGFEPKTWAKLVEEAQKLRQLLETESELVDDESVVAAATALRTALRPFI